MKYSVLGAQQSSEGVSGIAANRDHWIRDRKEDEKENCGMEKLGRGMEGFL